MLKPLGEEKVLIVDGKNSHLDEDNALVIHPAKLGIANTFVKGTYDRVVIKNSPSGYLKGIGFFNLAQALKSDGICEVYIDQPICAMQELDKGEIMANAKRGGFKSFIAEPYEYLEENEEDEIVISTIKLTMDKIPKKPTTVL